MPQPGDWVNSPFGIAVQMFPSLKPSQLQTCHQHSGLSHLQTWRTSNHLSCKFATNTMDFLTCKPGKPQTISVANLPPTQRTFSLANLANLAMPIYQIPTTAARRCTRPDVMLSTPVSMGHQHRHTQFCVQEGAPCLTSPPLLPTPKTLL
jgi:hypothetical protein